MSVVQEPTNESGFNPELSLPEFFERESIDMSIQSGGYFASPATQDYDTEKIKKIIGYKNPELIVTTVLEEIGIIPNREEIAELNQKFEVMSEDSNNQEDNLQPKESISRQLKEAQDLRLAIKHAATWYDSNIRPEKGKIDIDKLEEIYDATDQFQDSALIKIINSFKIRENEPLVLDAERIARILISGIAFQDQY